MIADETLDMKRQPLLDLAISGRHRNHSLWLLTQSYTAISKNLRRQKKQLFLWYPAEKSDFKLADEETNVLTSGELENIKQQLKDSKHGCLYIRLEHPRNYAILEQIKMKKQASVVQTVTRPKHPGRVAGGKRLAEWNERKRLAEWNRKNKKDLLKNKDEVPAQVPSRGDQIPAQVPSSGDQVPSRHTSYSAGLGIILLICVAGGGIYFYSRKTPAAPEPPPKKKEVRKYMD